jgi:hypothetical protein
MEDGLKTYLRYLQVKQTTLIKKGSKISPFIDDIVYKNLSSQLTTNSHDYPEIKLNSSKIYFSGSENSPEKMDVISTIFSVDLNYDTIY